MEKCEVLSRLLSATSAIGIRWPEGVMFGIQEEGRFLFLSVSHNGVTHRIPALEAEGGHTIEDVLAETRRLGNHFKRNLGNAWMLEGLPVALPYTGESVPPAIAHHKASMSEYDFTVSVARSMPELDTWHELNGHTRNEDGVYPEEQLHDFEKLKSAKQLVDETHEGSTILWAMRVLFAATNIDRANRALRSEIQVFRNEMREYTA